MLRATLGGLQGLQQRTSYTKKDLYRLVYLRKFRYPQLILPVPFFMILSLYRQFMYPFSSKLSLSKLKLNGFPEQPSKNRIGRPLINFGELYKRYLCVKYTLNKQLQAHTHSFEQPVGTYSKANNSMVPKHSCLDSLSPSPNLERTIVDCRPLAGKYERLTSAS